MESTQVKTPQRESVWRRLVSNNNFGVSIALIILLVAMAAFAPNFTTLNNIFNVLLQIAQVGTIAVGMTYVILTAGIDLSVGSIVAFDGLAMAMMMKTGVPVVLAILAGLVIGGAIGGLNGFLVAKLNLQPFVATLGTMTMFRGLAYTISGGQPVYTLPAAFDYLGGSIGVIPIPAILMVIVFIIGAYTLKYTKFGRHIYAIGGNAEASKLSGIKVKRNTAMVYIISGLCCAIAAVILTARLDSAVPTAADGIELDVIAAVAIGGTDMQGGKGAIFGTIIGALIMGVIANGLNLLDVAQGPQRFVKGVIIILAVVLQVIRNRK
ncbi:ABC transporter permease [Secundilactobacillus collinoides]|uniref:Ribose ABC transporter permease n=2 Tax=Secundilactobacillus collinoides TaxID=33960 RepID=A0A0R2B8Y3_SECCO|nr:ribose ABC transporter permease [Secundilactobacillus collinoides]KRM75285.1 ribose ABC transporter permease [Secundilactobacillus collinoides DSM 20515 = JCM 1123]